MKKALWPALSILAIAHLIMLTGFVGFLGATDRLSRDRLEQIRVILATTLSQDEEQAAADTEAQEQAALAAKEEAEKDLANAGTEARNERLRTMEQAQQELLSRARRDLEAITQLIALRLAEVERREAELTRREKDVLESTERERMLAKDEQFKKTVALLAGLKPDALKTKIDVYLSQERFDFVVDLLEALPPRTASKLLALYAGETDNRMAADLLLRLKDRGTGAGSSRTEDGQLTSSQQP